MNCKLVIVLTLILAASHQTASQGKKCHNERICIVFKSNINVLSEVIKWRQKLFFVVARIILWIGKMRSSSDEERIFRNEREKIEIQRA